MLSSPKTLLRVWYTPFAALRKLFWLLLLLRAASPLHIKDAESAKKSSNTWNLRMVKNSGGEAGAKEIRNVVQCDGWLSGDYVERHLDAAAAAAG